MRAFEHPNFAGGFTCPICRTGADRPVVLIPVRQAYPDEPDLMVANQVHERCWDLAMSVLRNREDMGRIEVAQNDECS